LFENTTGYCSGKVCSNDDPKPGDLPYYLNDTDDGKVCGLFAMQISCRLLILFGRDEK